MPSYPSGRMPEPSAVDVAAVLEQITSEFGLYVTFETKYDAADVTMVARAYKPVTFDGPVVQVQAMSRVRLHDRRSRDAQAYRVAFDLYQQLDTGIIGFEGGRNKRSGA